jgi:carbon-monoxide dehydrogenase large subunit
MLTASLLDYIVPSGPDLPDFELHHLETPAPTLRGGFKGVGEGGVLAPPAALANAVGDALAIEINRFPIALETTRAAVVAMGDGD